jgi:hypothetical protein
MDASCDVSLDVITVPVSVGDVLALVRVWQCFQARR